MDSRQAKQAKHTANTGISRVHGVVRTSNAPEIRHRRLLSTLSDLHDSEILRLQAAIERNRVAGSFPELMTGTNAQG